MKTRTLTTMLNVGIFLLLALLALQTADIRRSLRHIEHEERRVAVQTHLRYPFGNVPYFIPAWYLLQPPMNPFSNDISWQAPLIQWYIKESFQTNWECWAARRRLFFDACPKIMGERMDTPALGAICIAAAMPT